MTMRAVHWHEGMFLRPHHFQTAQRYIQYLSSLGEKWDLHYNWGLRSIELDLDALSNFRFVVRDLKVRLRDGTLVSIPEDGVLPNLDLKDAFEKGNSFQVFLGVPVLNLGKANVSGGPAADGARFVLDAQELEDENTGVNPQPIQVRLLNLKLLLSTQDHGGYEVIPLASIRRSDRAEATPELDVSYIPPLLACDAWKPLQAGILEAIYDRIGKKLELLAGMVANRGITFDSTTQGDPMIFNQLRMVNEAFHLLGIQFFAQGIHPLHAYLELNRLVGQLSIIHPDRRRPKLPDYDHDDLGKCFYRAKQELDMLLDIVEEPKYKEVPFVGAGLRMQVPLEPAWLESIWQMYVGVQNPPNVSTEQCIEMLTRAGRLDMKIGSSDRVDEIYKLGQAGLKFAHTPRPPRALPTPQGLVYFQVLREASPEEWKHVQRSLSLAIRLNENLIAGNIQGQRVLTVRYKGQTTTMQFTLYLVPEGK
jgi:type VI secretion system protein ImpJ